MYIRWQSRKRARAAFGLGRRQGDVHWRAILVENKRVCNPKQEHIAYVVGFTESALQSDAQRCHIWDRVSECLRLANRITLEDRKKIEAAIATKVLKPTHAEYKKAARRAAELLGWDWISEGFKAALKDEADQYRNA
jgi:hypothetical protein